MSTLDLSICIEQWRLRGQQAEHRRGEVSHVTHSHALNERFRPRHARGVRRTRRMLMGNELDIYIYGLSACLNAMMVYNM